MPKQRDKVAEMLASWKGADVPVTTRTGKQIGHAHVNVMSSGDVECEIKLDSPMPDLYDAGPFSIDTSRLSDPLFPVVITQTTERVVWVRACADDEATDIVAENAAEHFTGERSSEYHEPVYDVRVVKDHQVPH